VYGGEGRSRVLEVGEKWKKVAYQEEAGQGYLAGYKGREGAKRLVYFNLVSEIASLNY
jgi:hypothetical protein